MYKIEQLLSIYIQNGYIFYHIRIMDINNKLIGSIDNYNRTVPIDLQISYVISTKENGYIVDIRNSTVDHVQFMGDTLFIYINLFHYQSKVKFGDIKYAFELENIKITKYRKDNVIIVEEVERFNEFKPYEVTKYDDYNIRSVRQHLVRKGRQGEEIIDCYIEIIID